MATCDANQYLDRARCFECLTIEQMMAVRLALSCRILQEINPMANCDVNDLLDDARCFECLTFEQMMAVSLQLECEILHAGGGGGSSCIICDTVDPVDEPTCTCAIAYNITNGGMWYWNDVTTAWVQLIGG